MEVVWLQRDGAGAIKGVYANKQPGYAEEQSTSDDPAVIAFLTPRDPVPQAISDRQFFQQLAAGAIISQSDALAAVRTGTIPAPLQAIVNAMPADQQFAAQMMLSGATIFERSHPMTQAIGAAYGWPSGQVDQFFRDAAAL